ncbi:MAG: ATP-binding protein [Candidatus Dormibacter sp.]
MRHASLVARARILLISGWAALVAAIVVSGYGAWAARDGYLRADAARQVELANKDLLVGMVNQESGLRGYINSADPVFLEPYNLGATEIHAALQQLAVGITDQDLRTGLNASRAASQAWQAWATRRKERVDASGAALNDVSESRAGKTLFDTFRNTNGKFQTTVDGQVAQAIAGARRGQQLGFALLLAAGLIAAAILAALGRTLINGTLRPIAGLAASARDLAAGRPARVLASKRSDEVGDLSRALAAWQATAKDRDHIFTLSADMFAVAGFDGIFRTVNPSWERVTGWSALELTSKPYIEFVHPDDRAATIAEGGKLAEGAKTISFRNRYQCQDGSYRWLEWTAVPVEEEKRFYAVARDVTDQQSADDSIRALNGELEAFSYSVSHDLRAPLRAIHGFVRIILEDHSDEFHGEARRYLDLVAANAQQMGRLVDDLLRFSRLGRQALNTQHVSANAIVRGALDQLQAELEGRAAELTIGDLPSLDGDPTLLQQVFLNLIGNAIKYTKGREPARIEVGSRTDPNHDVVYFVKDNGAGFDMQYADKLFGVFQRLHRSDEYEGTGVGLALVQRIIIKHGGRIWADAAVGRGATFSFTLGGAPAWQLQAAA